jgi:hypothetical protein
MWFAENVPEPASVIFSGSVFAAATAPGSSGTARLVHHHRVGGVLEEEHRGDVVGLVVDVALERPQHACAGD